MNISEQTLILIIMVFLLIGGAFGAWLTRLLMRYPFGRAPLTGKDAIIGKTGRVISKNSGRIRVAVNSQGWNAESNGYDSLEAGDYVRVVGVDNLTLTVVPDKPIADSGGESVGSES